MYVKLSDGRQVSCANQYDLAKLILFGAPRMGVTVLEARLRVTPETEPLFRIRRKLEKRKLQKEIEEHLPF